MQDKGCLRKTLMLSVLISAFVLAGTAGAATEKSKGKDKASETEKSGPVEVGGLYFDYDEGVEIEQGPGGQVLVKSNRDYMKNKFQQIEDRLSALDQRVSSIEKKLLVLGTPEDEEEVKAVESGRRVLAT